MGMYTEFVCALELKSDTPEDVIHMLCWMTGQEKEKPFDEDHLPNHPLFETERWRFMLQMDSYYFEGDTQSRLRIDHLYESKPMYFLTIRCNLKNYNSEIEKFIDWITPYAKTEGFIGYKRYEEVEDPTLIYL